MGKSARGVDERTLPWGSYFEPTWASVYVGHREGRVLPLLQSMNIPLDCAVLTGCKGSLETSQTFV